MTRTTIDAARLEQLISGAVAKAMAEAEERMETTVSAAVRKGFADVGLRVDEPDHVDEAWEDFRFLRRMRAAYDSAAGKVGGAVIIAMAMGLLGLVWTGLQLALATKTGAPPR